jgi:hypothetical protein
MYMMMVQENGEINSSIITNTVNGIYSSQYMYLSINTNLTLYPIFSHNWKLRDWNEI